MFLLKDFPLNQSPLNNVQILTVDNDRDSGILYATLFGNYAFEVIATSSIKEAFNYLDRFVPDVVICEARFMNESADLLIQRVRSIAQNRSRSIPVLVTSTCPLPNLSEYLKAKVDAYQIKPLDIDRFVDRVWNLVLQSKRTEMLSNRGVLVRLDLRQASCLCAK